VIRRYDSLVLGLGAMGSAAAYHLAKKGRRVLGIERFSPPHARGSTHGSSRITRLAIGEGAQYTPLAIRSHELWRELEKDTGETLLTTCGGLVVSSLARTSKTHVENFFDNTVDAATRFGIAHELLDASEIRRRFPPLKVADDERGYFEPGAGFVRPEACVRANLTMAARWGVEIHRNETVQAFDDTQDGVVVTTDQSSYVSEHVIVATGSWLPGLVDESLARHFTIYRQVMLWFAIARGFEEAFLPDRFPIFIWELKGRPQGVYGFPAIDGAGGGVKVASETFGVPTTPETIERGVSDEETYAMYDQYVAPFVDGVRRECLRAATCLYTVTRDFGFVIDRHPSSERIWIVSPCSGHGFKHSAAIGEALAEIAVSGESRIDLSPFKLDRFRADEA
jgi:sarcosine oxidase